MSLKLSPPHPTITVPSKEDFGTNQELVFSNLHNNAISINDPLAVPLPDSLVSVVATTQHGTLALVPEHAKPWQNIANPLDVDQDGNAALNDTLQLVSLLNHPTVLAAGGQLPTSRSITSDLPLYDVNGDGMVTSADAAASANSLVEITDSLTTVTSTGVVVEGDGTSAITLTGRAADINAMLDGLTYIPTENSFFDDAIDISVNRFPEFYAETIDVSIPLTPHALTLGTDDGTSFLPTTYEQGSGHQTLLDHVMIHDAASGHIDGATITIGNYQQGKDILDLDIEDQMDLGVHATFDAHKGLLRLSGFASVEDYQQALHLISFSSTGSSDKTLTIEMGDDVNDRAELTELVHIITVNQPPVVDPGMGTIFTAGGGTAAVLPSLTVTDLENGTIASAAIALEAMAYIRGQDVLSFVHQHGIDSSFDAATGVLTLTGTASAADYTAALRSVQYSNLAVPATTGIRELTVTVNDGQMKNPETTVMERLLIVSSGVTLVGPTLSNLPTATIQTPVDETPVVLAPDLVLTDADMVVETLISADVAITGNFVAGDDFLNVKGLPEGIEWVFDPLSGILHLSGCAPVYYYEYALQQVTYSDHETARDGLPRTITFTAHDGFTAARSQSVTVQAEALPVVEAGFGALVYTHGQVAAAIDPELIVEYNGGTTLSGAEVAIIWDYMADEDRLVFADQNGITGSFDEQAGILTLTGTASVTDYQTALRSVQYLNTRVNPVSGFREVEFHVSDGTKTSDQGDLLLADFLIDVETEYVPPVLTLDTTLLTFVENSGPLTVAPSFTITDQDTPLADGSGTILLDGATVRIEGYVEGEDFLSFTPEDDIDGEFDAHRGELFLAGHASLADYETVMRSVTYENISEAPTTEPRHLLISLQEGAVDDEAPVITIDVQSLNNPPTRTSAAPADITVLENVASISLGKENVTYDPPSDKGPELVFTVDIVPEPTLGHIEFDDGTTAEVGNVYTLDQFHSATFIPALNATGDGEFAYTVAGFNPILDQPDPAHLIESVNIHVVGVETLTPSDSFEAQIYRDLLNRNPTQTELDATTDDFLIDNTAREDFINSILIGHDYEALQISGLFEDLLDRPATTDEVEALFAPPHALSEDFSGTSLSQILQASDDTAITLANGAVGFTGDRNFVRTALAEYAVNDFTAEVTVTVGGDGTAALADQVVYFGMGSGEPDAASAGEPVDASLVQLRIGPDGFLLDGAGTADVKDDDVVSQSTSDVGGTGTHRLRLVWDGASETAIFSIDQDYTGGPFVADKTFAAIDGSDNLFDIDNGKIFFGGAGGATFDDFVISGDPLVLNLDEIETKIIASDEYFLEQGHDTYEGFVEAMYEDLLNRAPTDAELDKHVDDLIAGADHGELATLLAQTNEGAVHTVDGLIGDYLRRPGELFELVDQARILQNNGSKTIVSSILTSDEYFTRYGTQTSADSRSADEIEQELILQWLLGEGTPGNSVETEDFEAVGVIGDGFTGRGGGTLIAPEYVLTAAHLVAGHDPCRLRFSVGATTYGVTQVEIHPGYNPSLVGTDGGNDIAVLRLNRAVVDVQPTLLLRGGLEIGDMLTLVGFGAHPGDEQTGTKRVGTTQIDGLTPRLVTWIYDDASEATTVPGDSGSPQFVLENGQYYVASGGTHQASALGDFAYNTRVDAYFEWIASAMGVESSVVSGQSGSGQQVTYAAVLSTATETTASNHASGHNVELHGDDLIVADISAAGVDDDLSITTTATHVVITDANQTLTVSVPNATGNGTNTIMVPLSAFSGNILVNTAGGDDAIFTATPSRKIVLDAGSGTNSLTVQGSDGSHAETFAIRESGTAAGHLEVSMVTNTTPGPYTVQSTGISSLTLNTGAGNDTVRPGDLTNLTTALQNLTINLGDGNDILAGENTSYDINVTGGDGADILRGGTGNDRLEGGGGNDSLLGGPGDDTYVFNVERLLAADVVTEQTAGGTDTLDFSNTASTTIAVDLRSTAQQTVDLTSHLKLTLSDQIENVTGGAGGNVIIGSNGPNVLVGGSGIDVILGAGGNDTIVGQNSGDVLGGNEDTDFIDFHQTDVTFPGNVTATFDLAGPTAGSQHDQVRVFGNSITVTLGDAPLVVNASGFTPQVNQQFVIVSLASASTSVSGTCSHGGQPLVQGAALLADGRQYQIDYQGGDGNDVVLTFTGQTAGFTVTQTDGATVVAETATTDTFAVVLDVQPASDVVINVNSGDTGEATVDNTTLTFTNADWNTPQTVTVTGVDDTGADGNQNTPITLSIDDAASDDTYDALPDQTVTVTTTDDEPPSSTSGDVDGDSDFDASDAFLIHLIQLSGTDAQIDQAKGGSPLTAAEIRTAVTLLTTAGDVDGDGDFDASDSFLIQLVKLSGTDAQIDQSKGSSPLDAATIRARINALGGGATTAAASAQGSQVLQSVLASDPVNNEVKTADTIPLSNSFIAPKPTEADLFADAGTNEQSATTSQSDDSVSDFASEFSAEDFRQWIDAI